MAKEKTNDKTVDTTQHDAILAHGTTQRKNEAARRQARIDLAKSTPNLIVHRPATS